MGSGEVWVGQAERGDGTGGERPMGTAACRGGGSKERTRVRPLRTDPGGPGRWSPSPCCLGAECAQQQCLKASTWFSQSILVVRPLIGLDHDLKPYPKHVAPESAIATQCAHGGRTVRCARAVCALCEKSAVFHHRWPQVPGP